tara:strand:+ start:375 stop:830 length:456 start_codon:yes stop_codon:yes gene_type:complete
MELKKIFIIIFFCLSTNAIGAELKKPDKSLDPYDVIKIQLDALKNNDKNDQGIRQTWLFAHPNNKKATGPYPRFRIMIYGNQYKHLINHSSHKIKLISSSEDKYVYRIDILSEDKKLFFYEWHVQKGDDENCKSCWFTSAVSQPFDQGNTI